jgi:hypothetical protein
MKRAALGSILLLLALGGLPACENVSATVNCVTTAVPSVECEVKETDGKTEVEVCWDFSVTCKNGTKIVPPRSCTKVKDGGAVKYTIPADKLPNVAQCDGEPKAEMTNLTINGKAPSK